MKAVQISRGGCIVRSDAGARPLQLGREEREREKVGEYFEHWDHGGHGERERGRERGYGNAWCCEFNDV